MVAKAKLKIVPSAKREDENCFTSYVEIKNIISQILFGEDLKSVLNIILEHIEKKLPKARASILLVDSKNNYLISGAAPSLPEGFFHSTDGLEIGPGIGCSGSAAYYRKMIVVRDTSVDPLWVNLRTVAREYELRACFAVPILTVKGELLGTFALYFKTPHKPTKKEIGLVSELIDLVCLAIERDRSAALKKQIEEEVQMERANALNSLKFASLGEMAKNISHEINSPLAIIKGSVHQINRIAGLKDSTPEKLLMYTSRLERSVERIEKIVSGLRSLTREASNDSFRSVSSSTVIEDALAIFQERFVSSNVALKLTGDIETLFECRSIQISQVLVNLLTNSFDAISHTENPWIEISVEKSADQVRFIITDSGNGIPLPIVDKIMIPLFTTKLFSRATGLGLSVAQAFIHEHNGKIWYDKSSQHTRFVIELPLEQIVQLKQAV